MGSVEVRGRAFLLLGLAALLVLGWMFVGDALHTGMPPADDTPAGPEAEAPAPGLLVSKPPASDRQANPEPVRSPAVDAGDEQSDDGKPWGIAFEITGAQSWWRADFVPVLESGRPARAFNQEDGILDGELEVVGRGRLVVRARGCVPWISDVLEPPARGTRYVTATMKTGLSISGAVLAADGATPVREGQVRVAKALGPDGRPEKHFGRSWVQPDAHGRFHLTGLSPGPVVLRAWAHDKTLGDHTEVEVEAGDEGVSIRLRPMGLLYLRIFDAATKQGPRTASIQIVYPTSSGTDGMSHTARNPDADPGPPVEMRLSSLQLGTPALIRVRANGYQAFETEVTLPAEGGLRELDVPLRKGQGGEALLVLTLRVDGGPDPESVSVMRWTGKLGIGAPEPVRDGRVELRLAPGTTAIEIGPADRAAFWVPVKLTLAADATKPGQRVEQEVQLVRGGQLRFSKRPPRGVVQVQQGPTSLERPIVRTRGHPAIVVLAPGRWSFRVKGRDETWSGEAEIRAGEITDATWNVTRAAR